MAADGVKPSMAGDIWSHKGCSLMGICIYGITSKWIMKEWLVCATPFGQTRHTGVAIDDITVAPSLVHTAHCAAPAKRAINTMLTPLSTMAT
eukprot:scaffold156233_cov37-Tisochrysis_lutea.AAC.1